MSQGNDPQLLHELSNLLAMQLPQTITEQDLEQALSQEVNTLIQHDFNRLVGILYRMDVSEQKLKQMLKEHAGTDAGLIIARMMIERQRQKIKTRAEFRSQANDSGEEKW